MSNKFVSINILENAEIQENVRTLVDLIDRFDADSKQARHLIVEIATKIDESRICERHKICRHIKVILTDKIKEGKITTKWIEECLPKEFKRAYKKSELSSLSKKNLVVQTDSGLVLLAESDEHTDSTSDNMLKSNKPNEMHPNKHESVLDKQLLGDLHEMKTDSSCTKCQDSLKRIVELEQALRDYAKPVSGRMLRKWQGKYIINKQQKFLIDKALDNCNNYCLLTFNESGALVDVESDHSVEVQ